MIFRVFIRPSDFITLIVRASSEEVAREIAAKAACVYNPANYVDELELLDPEGADGVLVEDAS